MNIDKQTKTLESIIREEKGGKDKLRLIAE